MGNCYGRLGSSSKRDIQDYIPPEDPDFLHQEEEDNQAITPENDDDRHHDHNIVTTSTTRSSTPFLGTPLNNKLTTTTTTSMLPFVDPRLESWLDFFRQLQARRKVIFNKVMPVHRHDFEAIFSEKRNVQQLEKKNSKMGGMVRPRSMSFGDEKGLKSERFKVKPIDSGGVQSLADGKGAGVSMPTGSK